MSKNYKSSNSLFDDPNHERCAGSFRLVLLFGVILANSFFLPAIAQETPEKKFAMGAIPATPEEIATFPATPTYRAFLPEKVDLSKNFPKPGDQGDQGSCVGWAVGYAARAYYTQAKENRPIKSAANIPSPAYIFNSIRVDRPDCEGGSSIINALHLLKKGVLSLGDYPYSDRTCPRPSDQQLANANEFRITDWRYVNDDRLDQIKGELAQGNPVIISMGVRPKFHRLRGAQIYDVDGSDYEGFHALTVTGYDERKQAFRVINSWGTKWGDRGYGWISYRAFKADVRDAYTMRVSTAEPKPVPVVVPIPEPSPAPAPPVDPVGPINVTGLECGHVQIVRRSDKYVATGFVGSSQDMDKLSAQLLAYNALNEVLVRPWPQCEALLTLDSELSSTQRPDITLTVKEADLSKENLLVFDVTTPSFPGYLHIAYIQADGSVVNLKQSSGSSIETLSPGTRLRLGDGAAGSPKFRIVPPFGSEMMLVISSKSPLFTAPRPVTETEREFLTALRQAIISMPDSTGEARLVTANYLALTTKDGVVVP